MQYEESLTLAAKVDLQQRSVADGIKVALTALIVQLNRVLAKSEYCPVPSVDLLEADGPHIWTSFNRGIAYREIPVGDRREAHAICAVINSGMAAAIGQFDADSNLFRAQHPETGRLGPVSRISYRGTQMFVRLAFCDPGHQSQPLHALSASAVA
ncbi:MAG: hypothetical protein K0S68_828 [Candidatus Saccharibacteria bacterium]|jgi:hypothetical protein|nr:hypothetical protein [Candidatus Saccharibacteria bacterium]